MSNKYFSGRKCRYIFCDICGQACYIYNATKLDVYTGKGGLIVCKNDIDKVDFGLVPYKLTEEKRIDFVRINHQNVDNSSEILDYDTTTELGV